jgi:ubiquitin-activating enzyme E1 C
MTDSDTDTAPTTSTRRKERERSEPLRHLLERPGFLVPGEFEPCPEIFDFLRDDCRVLVVGAGGLGCELLKDLALTGFGHIDVIDMDTIDVSNLNRQFLFRPGDVGQPKATVAASRIEERVEGVKVTPHPCMIQDKPLEFYDQFHVIVLGLDSLEARRYMNTVACSFLEYRSDGTPRLETIKPMVDGGTEGFKGHARVLLPGVTPCFECTMWLFPPQTTYPLCTLAETPRYVMLFFLWCFFFVVYCSVVCCSVVTLRCCFGLSSPRR